MAGMAAIAGTAGIAGMAGSNGLAGTGGSGSGGFPPVTDFAEPGPFDVTQASDGPSCTVHRPTDAALGGPDKNLKHPVITWGNGTGTTPSVYAGVLRHWASHGFIVTAANSTNTGDAVEMEDCLDWILEQDTVSGPYMGRVDASKIGASGHSQGGGGTLMIGRDERIIATAPLQPYILGGLGGFQSSSIAQQKAPMFLMSGSGDTIATPSANQQPVFDDTNVPVFWGTLQGATHTGTAIGNIGGYRGPATAWFRLHLMGDESARGSFYGDSCSLCNDSSWAVQRKGLM
jgi:predicted dienelactone hydrolase